VKPGAVVAGLRAATAADHDRVDALFAGRDLADRDDYRRFLVAHARALPAAEAALATWENLPDWRPRTPLLAADLADLDAPRPDPLPFTPPAGTAAGWGTLYVVEGSRLGGVMLARRIGADLPGRYLGAAHRPGEWRALLTGLEAAADGPAWLEAAATAARATFALYARAVGDGAI